MTACIYFAQPRQQVLLQRVPDAVQLQRLQLHRHQIFAVLDARSLPFDFVALHF